MRDPAGGSEDETTEQLRGSSMLMGGRLVALALSMATQVLIVRSLTKGDYGAFAYGLTVVVFVRTFLSLGLHQVISRFLSIYDERDQVDRMLGSLVFVIGMTVAMGAAAVVGVLLLQDVLLGSAIDDPQAVRLLPIIVALAPIEALDTVFEAVFAVYSRPGAIFFRKYVLTPGLRLAVVLGLVVTDQSVTYLATGYVAAGLAGTALYVTLTLRVLRERGVLGPGRPPLAFPIGELLRFSVPLLTTELVNVSINTVSIFLLAYHRSSEAVGSYRAILPAARLNQLVIFTFTMLYVPLIGRLHARGDAEGIRDAYWRTAIWLAVFSFPVLALTGPLARPTTVLLFGERYASSSLFLGLLAIGYYANAALGFNLHTLQTTGHVRFVATVNTIAAVLNVGLALVLVPRYGALGVAATNAITLVVQNAVNQAGLRRLLNVPLFEWRYAGVYATVVGVALAMWGAERLLEPGIVGAAVLWVVGSGLVLVLNRNRLHLSDTFPEITRIPVVGRWLA